MMKVISLLAVSIFFYGSALSQHLIFSDSAEWKTLHEGKALHFRVTTSDPTPPIKYSLEGIGDSGIQFDSIGNFMWKPSYDYVDRLQKQKELSVIFQAEWKNAHRVRKAVTFTVMHENRPPVVEDLPVFYVKQSAVNHYQIST